MKALMPHHTPQSIEAALDAFKDSDSVELKLTIPDTDQRSALLALDIDVLEAQFRQVVFFDTPDLKLNQKGIVVRARRIRKGGDTAIKLRPIIPAEVPSMLRESAKFKVEMDVTPGAFVCSGSFSEKVDNADVAATHQGKQPVSTLFSRKQRALYQEFAPRSVDIDELAPLGPINIAKVKFTPPRLGRSMTAEVWFYPDASRLLELSTKCAPKEAFQVAAEMRAFLGRCGIQAADQQEMKTRRTLEYFSRIRQQSPAIP